MQKLNLFIFDFNLGQLLYESGEYIFDPNKENIKKAHKQYPIQMIPIINNLLYSKEYNFLPYPFDEFLGYTNRLDIKENAGILDSDSDFEKLYKLAGIDMITPIFTITQGN